MIKREIKEEVKVICDFCGNEFVPSEDYPRDKYGEYAKFNLSLTFGFADPITGLTRVYGEDSKMMGYCSGHICDKCLKDISEKIKYCKSSKEKEDDRT